MWTTCRLPAGPGTNAPREGTGRRSYWMPRVAPGGIEPPRADSKSAALSAELRGRRGSLDPRRARLAGEPEVHLEAAALAGVARDDELPTGAGDDLAGAVEPRCDWRTQLGSDAEERLEDACAEDRV